MTRTNRIHSNQCHHQRRPAGVVIFPHYNPFVFDASFLQYPKAHFSQQLSLVCNAPPINVRSEEVVLLVHKTR